MATKTFEYPSKRNPDDVHTVTVGDDGRLTCSCPGFTHRQACWHCDAAKERLAVEQDGQ